MIKWVPFFQLEKSVVLEGVISRLHGACITVWLDSVAAVSLLIWLVRIDLNSRKILVTDSNTLVFIKKFLYTTVLKKSGAYGTYNRFVYLI